MNIPAIVGVGIDVEHLLALGTEDTTLPASVTVAMEALFDGDESTQKECIPSDLKFEHYVSFSYPF